MLHRAGITHEATGNTIRIDTEGPRNEGYSGFIAEFVFDDNGALERTGVWE